MPSAYSILRRSVTAVARENRRVNRLNAMAARDALAQAKTEAREALRDYTAEREAQAIDETEELREAERDLRALLKSVDDTAVAFNFNTLKATAELPLFQPIGFDELPAPPTLTEYLPTPLSFFAKLFPDNVRRFDELVQEAHNIHDKAIALYNRSVADREQQLQQQRAAYEFACARAQAEVDAKNSDVEAFRVAYASAEREAVIDYFDLVFNNDELPDTMPTTVRITYDGDSRQLVIERELPTIDAIPIEAGFRYVKKNDTIVPIVRKQADRKSMYAEVVAALALRTIRIALKADVENVVDVFALNAFVNAIDPQTGVWVRPTLISFVASRASLQNISFDHVEPVQCLKGLKALVSRNAPELEAVRPLVQFDMVDRRFIEKTDVLSDLDSRPNLAELSPGEFESLMTNLFEKMGLETRLTQASRDGGVDCVAWDMRPVVGGKVVIQAKRYRNTVGVSAVRDLYGTMMNEGASKGILVATAGYGDTAYEFARNKPIELITGSNLLSLLDEYTHVKALIKFSDDWVDAVPWQ